MFLILPMILTGKLIVKLKQHFSNILVVLIVCCNTVCWTSLLYNLFCMCALQSKEFSPTSAQTTTVLSRR